MERRRVRTLPLDGDTLSLAQRFLKAIGPGDRVFPIARNTAWRIVRDCACRAGLSDLVNPETGRSRGISPHRLRDAFAVHALKTDDSGEGMRFLQEWLGHSRFDTTTRYRKVSGRELRQWHERLWDTANCSLPKPRGNSVGAAMPMPPHGPLSGAPGQAKDDPGQGTTSKSAT